MTRPSRTARAGTTDAAEGLHGHIDRLSLQNHRRAGHRRKGSVMICEESALAATLRSPDIRSEEHTSELQSLMRISYAVFCLKKKKKTTNNTHAERQYPTNIITTTNII